MEGIADEDLYQAARSVIRPRRLSAHAEAGSVGSALVTAAGNVYLGVSVDTSSGMGFCAEHNAAGAMLTAGESRIAAIVAVNADGRILPPCGRCREFLYQLDPGNRHTRVLLPGDRSATIAELLPEPWAEL